VVGATAEGNDKNLAAFLKPLQEKNRTFNAKKTVTTATESVLLLGCRLSFGSIRPDPNHLKLLIELKPPSNWRELTDDWYVCILRAMIA